MGLRRPARPGTQNPRARMPLLGGCAVFGAFAINVLVNYLVLLPLAGKIDSPFVDLSDLQEHIEGAFSVWRKLVVLLVGGFLMVALGAYDDKYDLKARPKLLAQIGIALLVALAGIRVTLFIHN